MPPRPSSATSRCRSSGSPPRPSPRPERGPRMSTTLAPECHTDEPQRRVTESDARSALRAVTGKPVIPARARLRFGPGRTCEAIARLLDRAIVRAEAARLDPRRPVLGEGSAEAGEDIVRVRRKAHGVADWIHSPTCRVRIVLRPAGLPPAGLHTAGLPATGQAGGTPGACAHDR